MTFLPRPCFLLVIVFGFVPIRFWESVAKENLAVAVQSGSGYLLLKPHNLVKIDLLVHCYQKSPKSNGSCLGCGLGGSAMNI